MQDAQPPQRSLLAPDTIAATVATVKTPTLVSGPQNRVRHSTEHSIHQWHRPSSLRPSDVVPGGSYYARSRQLTVDDYQVLIDRGWRRSGSLLYKPDLVRSCCPHYTIRLPAEEFTASRDQRQALHRWNRYVLGDRYMAEITRRYPKTKEEKRREKQGFDLLRAVHEAESNQLKPVSPEHRFDITLEPASFSEEKYLLFEDYQMHVHKEGPEDVTRAGFKRFLCESPLREESRTLDGIQQRLGSFHQCYRLDGRLVAVSVLDLLPHAVSGVYFIYHRDVEEWSFGKLSALREAALAIEGNYGYYYMGYYIHQCPKMRYKGDYRPQYVLDPITHGWHSLEAVKQHLDNSKFVSLDLMKHKSPMHESEDRAQAQDAAVPTGETTFIGPDGEPWLYRDPASAGRSGESLFKIRMDGLLTPGEIHESVNMDNIHITLGRGMEAQTQVQLTDAHISDTTYKLQQLTSWNDDPDITKSHTLRGVIAELVACVGAVVAERMALDFSR